MKEKRVKSYDLVARFVPIDDQLHYNHGGSVPYHTTLVLTASASEMWLLLAAFQGREWG